LRQVLDGGVWRVVPGEFAFKNCESLRVNIAWVARRLGVKFRYRVEGGAVVVQAIGVADPRADPKAYLEAATRARAVAMSDPTHQAVTDEAFRELEVTSRDEFSQEYQPKRRT
jgi:hypothetical protein